MNVDAPPGPFDFELSLFGPGYGECAVIHLGNNEWAIIDSCRTSTGEQPPIRYLEALGVDVSTSVRVIVASHWHDDHIRGLAAVADQAIQAKVWISAALQASEFAALVELDRPLQSHLQTGPREFRRIFDRALQQRDGRLGYATADKDLFMRKAETGAPAARVTALSPSDAEITLAQAGLAQMVTDQMQRQRALVDRRPNHAAVALRIDVGDVMALLGSDLEESGHPDTGWNSVLQTIAARDWRAHVFKVPHHGSRTAHHPGVWSDLLADTPVAAVGPFVRGRVRLPDQDAITRLCSLSRESFVTSRPDVTPHVRRSPVLLKAMREATRTLRSVDGTIGQVRVRRSPGADLDFSVDLFGDARSLCD